MPPFVLSLLSWLGPLLSQVLLKLLGNLLFPKQIQITEQTDYANTANTAAQGGAVDLLDGLESRGLHPA